MRPTLIFFLLLLPALAIGQKLPGGFNCEDLIDFSNGRISPNRQTSILVRQPQPKDAFGAALLSYDTELCRRLLRKEITVAEFNAAHAEKVLQLTSARQNLYAPFSSPLPIPNSNELVMRCGALGRGADFVTGRCM